MQRQFTYIIAFFLSFSLFLAVSYEQNNLITYNKSTNTCSDAQGVFAQPFYSSFLCTKNHPTSASDTSIAVFEIKNLPPHFKRDLRIELLSIKYSKLKASFKLDSLSPITYAFNINGDERLNIACQLKNTNDVMNQADFYYNFNLNTATLPTDNTSTIFSVIDTTSSNGEQSYIWIKAIQYNLENCDNTCLRCSGTSTKCTQCDTNCSILQNSRCILNKSNFFLQEGKCVPVCSSPHFNINGKCIWIPNCMDVTSGSIYCTTCQVGFVPVQTSNYEAQCQFSCPQDYETVNNVCMDKKREIQGSYLLQALYSFTFSSFEIDKNALIYQNFVNVNNYSSKYTRCGQYQLFGGFFSNRGSSLIATQQYTSAYQYVRVTFKWVLIDYNSSSNPTGLTVSIVGSSTSAQSISLSGITPSQICGLSANEYVGDFQYDFVVSNNKVVLNILNNMDPILSESEYESKNKNQYFGIRELSIYQLNCQQSNCITCTSITSGCTQCADGYFISSSTCQPCLPDCFTCSVGTYCLTCTGGRTVNAQNQCVCPSKQYWNGQICVTCQNQTCNTCDSSDSTKCLSCLSNTYLYNGQCQSSCPIQYFQNTSNLTCDQCFSNCQQCSNSSSCSLCLINFYLQPNSTSCLATCPPGYQLNTNSRTCKACIDSNCLSCQADINICTQCITNYNLQGIQCQTSCDSQYYSQNQVCQLCSSKFSNCLLCSNSQCTQCQNSYYLYQGTCINKCPQSYYQDTSNSIAQCTVCQNSKCSTCQPASLNCLTCISNYYLNGSNCVISCDQNMYVNSSNVCTLCSSLFVGCYSCSSTRCNSCISSTDYLDQVNNSCSATCPTGYFQSSTSTIPLINICSACDANCQSCTLLNNNCTSCNSNMYLQGNQCQYTCNTGYFANSNGVCVSCNTKFSNCSLCTANSCLQCQNSFYLVQGSNICVNPCPKGYATSNSPIDKCIPCVNTDCSSCNIDLNTCITCPTNKPYLSHTTCVSQCSSNQYINTITSSCADCNLNFTGCQTCTQNSCLTCSNSSEYLDIISNICVSSCGAGLIQLESPISKCVQDCQVIDSSQADCILCSSNGPGNFICQLCKNKKVLYQDKCKTTCPADYYADSQNICKQCSNLFLGCNTCTSTTCLSCQNSGFFFDPIIGQCVIQCQNGANPLSPSIQCQSCTNQNCKTCDTNDLNQCLSCNSNTAISYLQNGDCVQNCSSQYYLNGSTCLLCSSTFTSECISCDSTQCNQCSSSYYLSLDRLSCSQNCLIKQYETEVNGIKKCQNCLNTRCKQCDPTAPNICLSCDLNQSTQYLENGQCNLSCSSSTYPDQNKICYACSSLFPNCTQCTSSSCSLCITNYFLDAASNTCMQTCPPGKYGSTTTNSCEQCGQSTECSICNSSSPNICTQCNTQYYLSNSVCVNQCPDGTYPNSNKICQSCQFIQSDCFKCNTGGCTQCINGDIYLNPLTKLCSSTCPDGYFKFVDTTNGIKFCQQCTNPLCKTCQIDGSCLTCYSTLPEIYLNGTQCDSTCPVFIDNVNKICVNQCGTNQAPDQMTKICTICNDIIYNNQCITNCPSETIMDPLNSKTCAQCSVIYPDCLYCNSTQCTQCQLGFYLHGGSCVLNCPNGMFKDSQLGECVSTCTQSGYYGDSNSQRCQQCDLSKCAQCIDNSSKCTQCNNGFYLYLQTNQCYQSCPIQTYLDTLSQQCLICTQTTCLSCDSATKCTKCSDYLNPDDSQCYSSCPNGKYIYQNDCVANCPASTFYDLSTNTCINCPSNCLNCTSLTNCSNCKQNYQNNPNQTQPQVCDQCIAGYFILGQQCEICSTNCLTCTNSESYCLSCPSNQNLNSNNECVICQKNQYFDSNTLNCVNNPTGGATPYLIISDQISQHQNIFIINAYINFDLKVFVKNENWIFNLDQKEPNDYKISHNLYYDNNSSLDSIGSEITNVAQELKILLQIQITTSQNKIIYEKLFVNFVDPQTIQDSQNFGLKIINLSGNLPNYNPQTYPQLTTATQVLSSLAGVNLLIFLLSSPFYLLVSFFDILQLQNYLLYFNVQYDNTLYNIIRIFDFANFETIPNIKSEHSNAPYKFQQEKIDTFIFSNLVQSAAIWIFSYILYLISKYLNKKLQNSSNLFSELCRSYQGDYLYQIIVGLGFLTYCDILLSTFLQFYDIQNISVVTCVGIISSILMMFAIISLNFLTFCSIKINFYDLIKTQRLKQIYGFLYSGLELNRKKVIMNLIFLIRKTVVIYQLVFNQDSPVNQIFVCCFTIGVETTVMLILKPYKNQLEQVLHILSRVFMVLAMILIINLAISDQIDNLGIVQSKIIQIIISTILITIYILQISYLIFKIIDFAKRRYFQSSPLKKLELAQI